MGYFLVDHLHRPRQCEDIAAAFVLYDEGCDLTCTRMRSLK
ncbi:hypothetical protein LMG27177_04883 [Paraburkholderia fynbosensis]|uniref:Uncharacterized protein n=1 Tax=Paraburkholderia fynbosensis TaxID=1200993 RepID=A0A6J5GKC4_9BURK|nr:hypothetical protein LMG27177_04883 [Paraburkholderia fynbosensis]